MDNENRRHNSHNQPSNQSSSSPPRTTSQQDELSPDQSSHPGKGTAINIYTDSEYALNILHNHAAIRTERGFFTLGTLCGQFQPDKDTPRGSASAHSGRDHSLHAISNTHIAHKTRKLLCRLDSKEDHCLLQSLHCLSGPIPLLCRLQPHYTTEEQLAVQPQSTSEGWFLDQGSYLLSTSQTHQVVSSFQHSFHRGYKPLISAPSWRTAIRQITTYCSI